MCTYTQIVRDVIFVIKKKRYSDRFFIAAFVVFFNFDLVFQFNSI